MPPLPTATTLLLQVRGSHLKRHGISTRALTRLQDPSRHTPSRTRVGGMCRTSNARGRCLHLRRCCSRSMRPVGRPQRTPRLNLAARRTTNQHREGTGLIPQLRTGPLALGEAHRTSSEHRGRQLSASATSLACRLNATKRRCGRKRQQFAASGRRCACTTHPEEGLPSHWDRRRRMTGTLANTRARDRNRLPMWRCAFSHCADAIVEIITVAEVGSQHSLEMSEVR